MRTDRAVQLGLRRLIGALEAELAELERAIAGHLEQHPDQCAARDRLLSVPGVGARNVLPLVVLLGRWQAQTGGHGSPKGLGPMPASIPSPTQSGTSVHRHPAISRHLPPSPAISRQGAPHLRSRLYMGALGALRGHNAIRSF